MFGRPLSIRRLSYIFIAMLAVIMLIASTAGLVVLRKTYRTAADRFESEAASTLHNAAMTLGSQLQFYHGIARLIAGKPKIIDLLEFGNIDHIMEWGQNTRAMLPGSLGTALADPAGGIIGDARSLRVGAVCEADIARFASGESIAYPPVHRDVAGLEHFDLFAKITGSAGEAAGFLFISFRLEVLDRLLTDLANPHQRYILTDATGASISASPALQDEADLRRFEEPIPNTSWTLTLELPASNPLAFYVGVIVTDLIALAIATLIILLLIRRLMHLFNSDIQRIHNALLDVHDGVFLPSKAPPSIREIENLLPDIEALAAKLQQRQALLEQQSFTDPLTGLYNRRYFDILLNHDLMQSDRIPLAHLAVIDLNDFKHINDDYGHHVGDQALKEVASFLRNNVRSTDTVARLGGDEFALLLHNITPEDIGEWADLFIQRFDNYKQETLNVTCHQADCSLSIGIATVDMGIYATPHEVLVAADRAMYQAKHSGRTGSRVVCCVGQGSGA